METVTLILHLEAKTVNNPSNSSGVTEGAIAGATEGVTAVAAEQLRSGGRQVVAGAISGVTE